MRVFLFLLFGSALIAGDPEFNKAGELVRPGAEYREWIYLTTGLGMNYSADHASPSDDAPLFDNVFVIPEAYRAFKATGHWPDHTIFALEPRQSVNKGSINKGGRYQGSRTEFIEFAVKDTKRFSDGWGYFSFRKDAQTAKAFGPEGHCNECHGKNAAVENTFVQFYPTLLEIAKQKGTLRESYTKASETH
jgi:cytochrome P460